MRVRVGDSTGGGALTSVPSTDATDPIRCALLREVKVIPWIQWLRSGSFVWISRTSAIGS
jgi:hypothetical protein